MKVCTGNVFHKYEPVEMDQIIYLLQKMCQNIAMYTHDVNKSDKISVLPSCDVIIFCLCK